MSAAMTADDQLTYSYRYTFTFYPRLSDNIWLPPASSGFARLLLTVARYDISLAIFC